MALPSNGRRLITLVKIRIDIPLPTPRCVISSPSHMIRAVPAVMVRTISSTLAGLNVPTGKRSGMLFCPEWNKKTNPVDCSNASTTVT